MDRWIDGWMAFSEHVGFTLQNYIVGVFAHASFPYATQHSSNVFQHPRLNTTAATISDSKHSMCHCACLRAHHIERRRYGKSGANQIKLEHFIKHVEFNLTYKYIYPCSRTTLTRTLNAERSTMLAEILY